MKSSGRSAFEKQLFDFQCHRTRMLQNAAMCSIHIEQEKSLLPPVLRHRCISEAKRGRIGLREKESAAAF